MDQATVDANSPSSIEMINNEENSTTAPETLPFLKRIRKEQKQLMTFHPKEWLNGFRSNPKYPLFVKGDIDGFVVLFSNNLATLLAIILSAKSVLGNDIIYERMVPGFGPIPIVVVALVAGTGLGWATFLNDVSQVQDALKLVKGYPLIFPIREMFKHMDEIMPYLSTTIPTAVANAIVTIQCVESARQAGDFYPTQEAMFADGIGTLISSFCGSILSMTIVSLSEEDINNCYFNVFYSNGSQYNCLDEDCYKYIDIVSLEDQQCRTNYISLKFSSYLTYKNFLEITSLKTPLASFFCNGRPNLERLLQ
ncbi:unnamed protein product, partial [Rotaria sp. Silwood2]